MRNYIYLVDVGRYGRVDPWAIEVHYAYGASRIVGEFRWKWRAAQVARRMCRRIAESQGTNLRLELTIRSQTGQIVRKDSYGSDPRTSRG